MSKAEFSTTDVWGNNICTGLCTDLAYIVANAKRHADQKRGTWNSYIYYGSKKIAVIHCFSHVIPYFKYKLFRAAYTTSRNEAVNAEFVRTLKATLEEVVNVGEIIEEAPRKKKGESDETTDNTRLSGYA